MEHFTNEQLFAMLVGSRAAKDLAKRPMEEVFGFSKPRQMTLCQKAEDYVANPVLLAAKELLARCAKGSLANIDCFTSPDTVKSFLISEIGHQEHEAFWCLWLDNNNRLLAGGELFRGTVSQTSVFPREVVKAALKINASGVIFAHNHPSGMVEPSTADKTLTGILKNALALIDVRVLDHFVVSGAKALSFADRGLL